MRSVLSLALVAYATSVAAYDNIFKFNSTPIVETRSLDEIHQAALAEGGIVTLWHGGDLADSGDDLKKRFEERFPGITLNVTIDLSKYHDGRFDESLVNGNVIADSVILQTLHDFTRWADEGALLNYKPVGFDAIDPAYKDSVSAAWYGVYLYSWSFVWSTTKLPNVTIANFGDFLKAELKDKLVLTYPNDDDAVLYGFDLALQKYGTAWLDGLVAQNPLWVRGTGTPALIIQNATYAQAATFTSDVGYAPIEGVNHTKPAVDTFATWAQAGAIPKDAPHPEGAKLLHNYILSPEYQETTGWQVRRDLPLPDGFPYDPLDKIANTDPIGFARWMEDRGRVERLRFWFEARLGPAQGVSPLINPWS